MITDRFCFVSIIFHLSTIIYVGGFFFTHTKFFLQKSAKTSEFYSFAITSTGSIAEARHAG